MSAFGGKADIGRTRLHVRAAQFALMFAALITFAHFSVSDFM